MRKPQQLGRPCIERLVFIAGRLRQGQAVTVSQVATRFEVSCKTVHRDLALLGDRLGYEVVFDRSVRSWKLLSAPKPVL